MDTANILATVTEKVLEKPLVNFSNISISFSNLIYLGIIFGVAYFSYVLFRLLMAVQVKRGRIKKAQSKTLSQLFSYVIALVGIAAAFSSVGYPLTYLFLGSTALLVGLGFGLQQLFVDLISGVILLIDKNVNYGDVVRVDIPGVQAVSQGRILQIGLRATLLETIDNERIVVPNSKILANSMRSLMRSTGSVRFRVQIPVSFEEDLELVKKLMIKAVLSNEKVDQEPKPTIIIKEFGENGIILEIRFWMKELFNSENILSDIRFAILDLFNKNKILIPYPKRIIHDKTVDSKEKSKLGF